LMRELERVREKILDWDAVLFALFYHDIIYNALKGDNEEQSAELATERMTTLGVPEERVKKCRAHILATKKHEVSADMDTNLFTDADLSILGKEWEVYEAYCKNVRLEYSIYPDLVYKPGRKGVLKHFLQMERIFKTEHFFTLYEQQARLNIKRELEEL
jgi:predicted metal-dependent HD superfamily phosphohydrolase